MKFKRFLVLICICSLCICMTANVKARADAFPSASEILSLNVAGADLTGIANAYEALSSDQKLIANYIIGAFNNIYLCARGFSYSIDQNESAFKAQFLAMGELVWNYSTTAYAWRSRVNEVFRQYLSSTVVYASRISDSFENWYQGIRKGGANQLYIPYSQEAFDAWTAWYNDPSGDGIASLGETISEWDSGTYHDFGYVGYPFVSNQQRDQYNNFILNNSPVIYTGTWEVYDSYQKIYQQALSVKNFNIPDSLFISRNNYTTFRFGYSNISALQAAQLPLCSYCYIPSIGKLGNLQISTYRTRDGILSASGITNYDALIDYAFNLTPFTASVYDGTNHIFEGYYTYISHVFLVDDLNTLSNPQEIFNTEGLNIEAPEEPEAYYMISPNGLFISPIWPTADGDPLGFWDIIQDNSYDVDTQLPATDDDVHTTIINNNTINNYYVTNDDRINVPVEWFENELTDQLAQDSIPFLQFARDCIDCLGDLQIYLYGAVVFGLAGGILKKFLL